MNAVKKNQIWIYESIDLQRVVAKLKLTPLKNLCVCEY